MSSLKKLTIVLGSPDSLGRKFVDGNQEFQKLFGEDYISKWFPAAIVHYERNQESCFFIGTNDDLPVGQVDSRKDPSEILWTDAARSPSRDAFRILPGNVFEVLKNNIKAFQDDKDTEDAILSETSADSMSDGEEIVTVTRTESLETAGSLWVGLQSINTEYASLKSTFNEWVSGPNIRVIPPVAKRALYFWSWENSIEGYGLEGWDWAKDAIQEWPATLAIDPLFKKIPE